MLMKRTATGEDWLGILEEYDVQFLVLDPHTDSGLLSLFQSQPEWTVDFEDAEAVILSRTAIAGVHD